jgi:signal transduction histidine kinase
MVDSAGRMHAPDSSSVGESLAFERLLAELSAGFVNLSAASVDDAITDALRKVVGLLGVDRANLIAFVPQTSESYLTYSWTTEGYTPAVLRSVSSDFPWAMQHLHAGRSIVMSRLDELPAEAAADKATWRRVGVKSNLTVPMTVNGRIEGAIALASFRRERQWPDEIVSRLRILAEVVGNALAYKRARESLEAAMKFERLVSETLAALLTRERAADRNRVIEAGLREMGEILGADGATLWERVLNEQAFLKTHRWVATELWMPPDRADGSSLPWTVAQVAGGSVVRFASFSDLPPQAEGDLPALRSIGVRSMMVVPLTVSGAVVRALCFATAREAHDFPEALIPRVKVLGEVFASVLARDEAHRREQEARAQAAHATRVGAIGVFAATLIHELTQPLAASLANAETGVRLLAAPQPDLDELRATLADIVADGRRAGDLVQKLRRLLRHGEVERVELDPGELLDDALHLVCREAKVRGVQIRLEIVQALPKVTGDRVQLQQVVLNLLSNAIDAVTAGDSTARDVAVVADRCGDGVSVEVRDSGAGMDAQTLARIFQAFFTTKPKGMGLGLSISRTIIEAHGGTLSARSAPGQGATFRIELPVRRSRPAA